MTASRKAKEHLHQEKVNYETHGENDSPNGSYICEKCKSSSKKQGKVHCSNCKFWYHDCCSPTSFDLSLKQPYLVCSNSITELFHEFCCLFYLWQPMNINTFCDIWNHKVNNNDAYNLIQDNQSQLTEEKLPTTIFSQCLIKCQRRVFLIKNLTAGLAHYCRFCIIHLYQIDWQYLRNHLLQRFILYFKIWLKILQYLCLS